MGRLAGFEPATSRTTIWRYYQLSYSRRQGRIYLNIRPRDEAQKLESAPSVAAATIAPASSALRSPEAAALWRAAATAEFLAARRLPRLHHLGRHLQRAWLLLNRGLIARRSALIAVPIVVSRASARLLPRRLWTLLLRGRLRASKSSPSQRLTLPGLPLRAHVPR